jgi:hypothetical protein
MKKLLCLLSLAAVMMGCGKDEETPAQKIIGTWELQYYYQDVPGYLEIDFDKDKKYMLHRTSPATIVFSTENECGMMIKEGNEEIISNKSYSIDYEYIYITDNCNNRSVSPYGDLPDKILYRISNNTLIFAGSGTYFESESGYLYACTNYYYHTKK